MLSDQQLLRYQRQIFLPEMDVDGQAKLLASHITIVGAGGLAASALPLLVGAGVGQITLWDGDQVEASNLHRQTLFRHADIGHNKAQAAADALAGLNPDVHIKPQPEMLTDTSPLAEGDLILDCTDNLSARTQINQAAVCYAKPLVSGAAIGSTGQVALYPLGQAQAPCWHCVFPEVDGTTLNCAQSGVYGPVVQIIGAMQAQLAIQHLTDCDIEPCLHLFNGQTLSWRKLKMSQNPDCQLPHRSPAQATPPSY